MSGRAIDMSESTVKTMSSFVFVSYLGAIWVLPLFGYSVTHGKAFGIGLIFSVMGWLNSYIVRRIFRRLGE